jgi:sugar (pentulose or hexulose) kinase
MKALGIDIGTSSIKGAVPDLSSLTIMSPVSRPLRSRCGSRLTRKHSQDCSI